MGGNIDVEAWSLAVNFEHFGMSLYCRIFYSLRMLVFVERDRVVKLLIGFDFELDLVSS